MHDSLPTPNNENEPRADDSLPLGPNVVVRLRDGTVHGWPRMTLSHWSCSPIPSGDRFTLLFTEHRLTLEGRGLGFVLHLLEAGCAMELVEAGERHEATLLPSAPLIRRATIEARES
jgi:hypothetical protein